MCFVWVAAVNKPYHAVGHRGFPQRYPENTLRGLVAAAEAGASFVELDVQISADGVPMVFHDPALQRTTTLSKNVWDYSAQALQTFSAHEPARFGDKYLPTEIASLQTVCEALAPYDVKVFVEVKAESLAHISREAMLQAVIDATGVIAGRVIFISFDYEVVRLAKPYFSTGWVLRKMDKKHRQQAEALAPDVLIYNVKRCARSLVFWPGPWQWFLYDIIDKDEAQFWANKGVAYIETWDVAALL